MSKSLTNGTLSLRFMQNALRRQQLQEVELIRAEVKDDSKWELGEDVKEALGIARGTQQSDVVYESSYLPFLFSSEHQDSTSEALKPCGRRVFNKTGLDVSPGELQSQQQGARNDAETPASEDVPGVDDNRDAKDETQVVKGRKYRAHANPTQISSTSLNRGSLKGFHTFDPPIRDRPSSTKARDAIFSLGGVGTDLRPTKGGLQMNAEDAIPVRTQIEKGKNTEFLKPSGVDEPINKTSAPVQTRSSSNTSGTDIIDGARKKKRQRDRADIGDEVTRKKNKSKKSTLSKTATDAK